MTYLALKKLKRSTTASGDVAQLVLSVVLRSDGRSVATADDDSRTLGRRLDRRIEERLGALGELGELEDTRGTA